MIENQAMFNQIRSHFPALSRQLDGQEVAYFDGPAGTQVPQSVIDAIAEYLSRCNANHGGLFVTSRESDAMLDAAHQALADFVGGTHGEEIVFGPNMTTLTFALSRALARTWRPGDEIILTQLDHDANFTPWQLAARDAGVTVRVVRIHAEDCTLDLDHLRSLISPRTRLVAVGCASNSVGTINPVAQITSWAHEVGAIVFLDAVHYAPHALPDVAQWNCDFLACSTYKFFGPHQGVIWGRKALWEELAAYKVRPATNTLPGKWMTGTQSHELIAGALAAVDYLAMLGRQVATTGTRRAALQVAYQQIGRYEQELGDHLLQGLLEIPQVRVWGITDRHRWQERFATFSITHSQLSPTEVAQRLGEQGLFVWNGNYYALNLSETLGREPEGMVRIGLVHYNTPSEVDRLLQALSQLHVK
ncbi:MAG: cysteine desulfurase-like protein [Planctomycetota bacterium]